MNLAEQCPYTQMKALLIDAMKAVCQQAITSMARSTVSTQSNITIVSTMNAPIKWCFTFPMTEIRSQEEYDAYLQGITTNESYWSFGDDYHTVLNRQTPHQHVETMIHESSHRADDKLSLPDSIFWSDLLLKRLFYAEKDDITKLTFEEVSYFASMLILA